VYAHAKAMDEGMIAFRCAKRPLRYNKLGSVLKQSLDIAECLSTVFARIALLQPLEMTSSRWRHLRA